MFVGWSYVMSYRPFAASLAACLVNSLLCSDCSWSSVVGVCEPLYSIPVESESVGNELSRSSSFDANLTVFCSFVRISVFGVI